MTDVTIIDYSIGNLLSVQRAFEKVGATVSLASTADNILKANRLVLPGVGAFQRGMAALHERKLVDVISSAAKKNIPLMGICLGMQMLLDRSNEFGGAAGLGIIPGHVREIPKKINEMEERKIPHIGWSEIYPSTHVQSEQDGWKNTPLKNSNVNDAFYFVHSFHAEPENPEHIIAQTNYDGLDITAAIKKNKTYGFQFHPEKSGELGLRIIKQFLNE